MTQTDTENGACHVIYCDCCPHEPKVMAVVRDGTIEIVSRHGSERHLATRRVSDLLA